MTEQLAGVFFLIQARDFLSKSGDLSQTQIFAKIENVEVNFKSYCYFIALFCWRQIMRYGVYKVLWKVK